MPELTKEDIQQGVRDEMDAVRTSLAEEVTKSVSAEQGEKVTALQKSIEKIQEQLTGLEARGDVKPNDEEVKDLQKRLDEAETKLTEQAESIRLSKAGQSMGRGQLKSDNPLDGIDFGGRFIKDPKIIRSVIQGLNSETGETRALDSSLFSVGGKLPPQAANAFIDFVISQQATLSLITTLRMLSPQGYTDELRVSSRKMRAATEGTTQAVANAVTTKRRTLTTVETIWPEDITLTLLEDAIERMGTEGHIARLIATGFGNDLNDLAWNGDDGSSNSFLSINDGFIVLAQADSDVNDIAAYDSGATAKDVLHAISKELPTKFMGRIDLAFFVPVVFAMNYADEISDRATGLGDAVLINGLPALRYFGRRVIAETHLTGDEIMLTPAANLHFGVQRSITVDSMWQPRKRLIEYTITARTDFEYATGEAIVLADSVPSDLVS